jgi:hypothetical protein
VRRFDFVVAVAGILFVVFSGSEIRAAEPYPDPVKPITVQGEDR